VTDPDPSRVGLAVPEWAGLGQLASWAEQVLVICFKTQIPKLNLNIISFLKFNSKPKLK
jgi:hypothetical protein